MAKGSFKKTTNKWTSAGLEIKKNIEMLSKKPYVKIGVLEGKAEEPKKGEKTVTTGAVPTLVQVATFHEFGTKTIPQRSFLRGTINEFRSLFNQTTIQIHKKVMSGKMDPIKGLRILGEVIQSKVQERIRKGIEPAIKPATIDRKGSSTPLIDTGQLVNSIRYTVTEDGRGDKDGV